jgi:chemosensory pili system protein ChpA (sensor histidine kinase/response regulator)
VDDELREVFLEETDEVLQILHEYLPRRSAAPMTRQPWGTCVARSTR